MNRASAWISLGSIVLGTATGGGFWVNWQATRRIELALAQEHRLQLAALSELRESISNVAQRQMTPVVAYPSPAEIGSAQVLANVDSVVQKAVARQIEQVKLDEEARDEPNDAELALIAQGEQLVGDALKAQRWTDSDRASWRMIMGRLPGEKLTELMRQISVAMNEGRLRVQTAGPPF